MGHGPETGQTPRSNRISLQPALVHEVFSHARKLHKIARSHSRSL